MDAHRRGIRLTAAEIFGTEAFADEYDDEAQSRWGHTVPWAQTRQRVARFSTQDWIDVKAEGDALLAALAQAKRDGVGPGSAQAVQLRDRHRASIQRFYDCDADMHRCLAQMYLADARFTGYYDTAEPGLAQFVHDIVTRGRPDGVAAGS